MRSGRFTTTDPAASTSPNRSHIRQARAGLGAVALVALIGIAASADAAITITRTSGGTFYISSQAGTNNIWSAYAAYRITNTGPGLESDVWVKLDTFTGGVVSLATNEDGNYRLYTLAPGQSKMVYFYLTASGLTATPQGHTVRVYDRQPTLPAAVQLTSQVFSFTGVAESISSGQNKVDLLVQGPDPGVLGGIITVTVSGRTGTIGAGDVTEFTPASRPDWPADVFELYRADVTFYDIAGSNCTGTVLGTFTDQLEIPWNTTSCYTVVYKFRARSTRDLPTPTSPMVHVASGANIKHTDPNDIAVLSPITAVASALRLVKHASADTILTGDQVTYTLHATSGSNNSNCPPDEPFCNSPLFDFFVDILPSSPASPTYVPGSSKLNGSPLPDPYIAGSTMTWSAAFSFVAGGTLDITYDVVFPGTAGLYVNAATGYIGVTPVDTTLITTDSAPGQAPVLVRQPSDLVVTKTGPASVTALSTFGYTITVRNQGPRPANGVVVTDTLPAGVTFVSASNGGTHSGGVVTWPVHPVIVVGDSITRTLTVTAPLSGALVNVAACTSTNEETDPGSNNGSATSSRVTTVVLGGADLALGKTGSATVNAGQNLTYTLTVTNNGPSDAASVVVADTLPAGVTFVSADNGGTESGGVVTWPAIASLANGANAVVSVTVTAPATGTLLNVGRADAINVDPDTTNNNGSAPASRVTTTVVEQADLVVAKSGPATVNPGNNLTYTLTVTNNGPSTASSVVVQDTLPAGVAFLSADNGGLESAGVVTWPAVASLANGANAVFSVTVQAPLVGTLVNVARVDASTADPDTTNNNGSDPGNRVTTTVLDEADLALAKGGPASVDAAQNLTYTIDVTNNGPAAALAVVVQDTLPAGVTFVSADNGGTESGGVVTWPAIVLGNGANVSYSLTVTAPATGTLVNVARADAATVDPDTTNNNGSDPANRVTTTVNEFADVVLAKLGPASVNAGQNFSYTLTTTNNGPSDATGVVVQDTLPAGVTFVFADNGGTESGGVVTWPAIALSADASVIYGVTVTAPASGTLLNVARADAATADPDTTNNNGSNPGNQVTTTVSEVADLALAKSGPAGVFALGSITYTLTVTNNGPSDAAAVVVADTLPAGVTFVSADNGGTEAGGIVTWPAIATLANGANAVYSVTVTAPATGTLLNVGTAASTTTDPNPADNDGSDPASRVTTLIGELSDLALAKSGPASVNAVQTFSYTLTVTNNGPSDAAAVVVRDTLPAGVTFVSADNGGTESGGVVTWPAIATLANGANAVYSVTVTAPATGTLVNVARADGSSTDPDTTNNNGSDPANRVTTIVTELADVALTNSGPASVSAGQTFSYTLTVTNNGPSDAASVVMRDTLPAGVTFVSADNGGTESGGVVTWPVIPSLGNGVNVVLTVTVTAPPTGTLVNVGMTAATTTDPDPSNNDGSAAAHRVTTVVTEVADVALANSGPASVNAGQNFTYTLTVSNNGPSTAAAVVVRDTLPAGVTFVSADNGGTASGGVVTWPAIASLGSGANAVYTVTVTAPATGTLVAVGTAAATTADPDATNNDGSAAASRVTTVVGEVADVVVTNSGPAAVSAGQNFTYTVTVTNNGPSDAAVVVAQNALPAGVTFVSADNGGVHAAGVVTWPSIGTLANGASAVRTVTVTAPATGTLLDIASATSATGDPVAANNDGSAAASRVTTVVSEVADVALAKTGPASVNAMGAITYTLTATNNGPSTAAAVVVSDTLPAGVTFVSADNGGTFAAGVVTWPAVASLANGASAVRTVTVTAPATGTLVNVGVAASSTPDPALANNDGSAAASRVTTTVAAVDLSLALSHAGAFTVGQAATYNVTVTNVGTGTANTTITVTDTLPTGLSAAALVNGSGWSFTVAGAIVTATHAGPLGPSASIGFSLPVNVNAAAAPSVTNDAWVANAQDANPANNSATDGPDAVILDVSLVAVKSSSRDEVEVGSFLDYTVTVRNLGTSPVTDLVVNDVLPLGFAYREGSARVDGVAIADPAGAPGPSLQFTVGAIGSGAARVLTYRVEVGPGSIRGTGINRAAALSALSGAASNTAVASVRVNSGVFTSEGTIAGKVFLDCDCSSDSTQAVEELGVPGVRVALEDGTAVITDVEGKYHFVGVSPRLHVLRMDRATLPPGTEAGLMVHRQAGDGWSQFIELKAGELHRADFAVRQTPEVLKEVLARRERGEILQPVGIDPAFGTATVAGGASGSATGPGAYRGLLESRAHASTGHSMPLGASSGLGAVAAATDTSPAPAAPPAGAVRAARPSLFAVGLLQARLESWNKTTDAIFTERDRFEDELRDNTSNSDDGKMLAGGRAGLFLAGPVGRTFRIAVRYDSERDPRQRFFRDIRPDEHYPIYGDASVTEFFGQSRDRVFARLERGRSFIQYGDLSTANTNPLRGLGSINRVLNGGLGHFEGAKASIDAFGSRGVQRQVVDELPALGISGPYAMSRSDGLLNTERVEIITRERVRPSVIVSRKVQERFLDYSIEPFTGQIVFRRPVPSLDENLNPVSIRVTYESEAGGQEFWVYGAQGQIRPVDRVELGGSAVREEDPLAERTILSGNVAVELAPGVTLFYEGARSDSADVIGKAERAELRAAGANAEASLFGLRTDRAFSNPSAGFGPGREEYGARAAWQAAKDTRLFGEGVYSFDRFGRGHRTGGQLGIAQRFAKTFTGELAFRASEESATPVSGGTAATAGATPIEMQTVRARITDQVTPRASLYGEYERDLGNPQQHRGAVGGDVLLIQRTRAYGRYELISSFDGPYALNNVQERYAAVLGLASDDTPAGSLFGEYRLRDAIGGREAVAAIGLRNRWTPQAGLHVDVSAERVAALSGGGSAQHAAGIGLDYTAEERWRGTGRVEWRRAAGDDQVFTSLGYAQKLSRDVAVLGRASASIIDKVRLHGRGSFGVAWRETDRNQWNALARYEQRYDRDGGPAGGFARTTAHILSAHANYQPVPAFQVRGQVAKRITGFADVQTGSTSASLVALRGTWDFHRLLDGGLIGRSLFAEGTQRRQDGVGAELGLTPFKNLRIAGGYNLFGYTDKDLTGGSRSEHGFYVDLGFKLDEDVFQFLNPAHADKPAATSTPQGGQ